MNLLIKDIADVINISVSNPSESGYDVFVGLEHYDIGEPVITRYGSTQMLTTACKKFQSGDILLARRNVYLRRAGLVEFDGLTSGDSIVIRVKNAIAIEGIDAAAIKRLLPFILNTNAFWDYANTNSDGTMSKRLSPQMLLDYEFDIPELSEQKSLADKLWAAYKLKTAKLKLIAAINEMVKSQFIEMFGDPMVNTKCWSDFGQISNYTKIVLGSTPNSKNPDYWDGEIKWITPAEMTEESYYIYDTERHLTEEGLHHANLTLLPYRSVLFSTRAPIGKVGLVGSPMYCNQGFKNFICGEKLNPVYLYYALYFKREYLVSLGTGTTFKELSKKTVESLKIAAPPIASQNEFEAIYQQADKSKFELKKSIEKIDNVMKALMQ